MITAGPFSFLRPAMPRIASDRLRVLLLFATLLVPAGWISATRLAVDTGTDALLPETLPWRARAEAVRRDFPMHDRSAVVLVRGRAADAVEPVATRVAETLRAAGAPVGEVYAPALDPWLRRQALLLVDELQFETIARTLEAAQPLLGRLTRQPELAGLFDTVAQALTHDAQRLGPLLPELVQRLDASAAGRRPPPLHWSELLGSRDEPHQVPIIVRPQPGADEIAFLDSVERLLAASQVADGVVLLLTGEIPLWRDELRAADVGGLRAGLIAFAAVAVLLALALRSVAQMLACLATLAAGLVLTAAFATATVGRLNLISIAFAALYVGLAADFAVHFLHEWRTRAGAADPVGAARANTGTALLLCALTTSVAFAAFTLTDYRGVAELGRIGAAGILIGLACAWWLLPALLPAAPTPTDPVPLDRPAPPTPGWRHPRISLAGAALAVAICAVSATDLRMSIDPMRLRPPSPALTAWQELARSDAGAYQIWLRSGDFAQAQADAQRLAAIDAVGAVHWLGDLMAADPDRLLRIELLRLSVGDALPDGVTLREPQPDAVRGAALRLRDAARAAGRHELAAALEGWVAAATVARIAELQQALMGTLPALYGRIHELLSAQPVHHPEQIPQRLRRWHVDAQGRHLLTVLPAARLADDEDALRAFVAAVQARFPQATGAPVEYVEGARTVTGAFVTAFTLSSAAIVLLLAVALRRLTDVVLALLPLAAGSVLYLGVAAAARLQLNFANIIVLPLLYGIAVDTGIHLIWRHRREPGRDPLASPSGRAVAVSVLTTLASFAALATSPHPGMASIGVHLALGLACLLAAASLLIPAVLALTPRDGAVRS